MSELTTPRAALLGSANFRWLMGGGFISALGDQFTLIGLPWLILISTGDTLKMGIVIALANIPRAIFMLIGGAMVDRYSPKSVLMLTKYANVLLLGALSLAVWRGMTDLAVIGPLALAIGIASAFSIPSGTSMLPHVVAPAQLQLANGIMMGVRQLTMLAGPLLAALLFAVAGDGAHAAARLDDSGAAAGASGLALAFAFDALSFAVSAWTLHRVRMLPVPASAAVAPAPLLGAVKQALVAVWNDVALRMLMLYWSWCALVVGGTLQVALPVLAGTRLPGASALGLVLGAHGAGMLVGMGLSGALGALRWGSLGATLLLIDGVLGLLLIPMGMVTQTWQAVALMVPAGVLAGYMQVAVFSWIQQRVPRAMLGRTMSIFMFIFMGVAPLAAAFTGLLMRYVSLTAVFAGAGGLLAGAALLAFVATPIRAIDDAAPPGTAPVRTPP